LQAVILAAGKGSRIYPMAVSKPKPLIEIANKPVLEHTLGQMVGLVTEAIIVVGYKKDMIIEHLGDNYKGIKLRYVIQENPKGTGQAVLITKPFITGKFLVVNGDDLFSRKDMHSIAHCRNCILVKYKEDASAFGAVVVKDGMAIDIVEKSKEFVSNFVNTGMYCFSPEVFPILETLKPSPRAEYELTDAVKVLAAQGKMHAEEVQGHWIPVGYPWHILDATQLLLTDYDDISIKGALGKNVLIEGSVDIGEGSVIGDNVVLRGTIIIGKNCVISKGVVLSGYTALGDGTKIDKGSHLHNVIVGSGAHVQENCTVKDSVLGEGSMINAGVTISNTKRNEDETVKVAGKKTTFDSGKKELGAFVGDRCVVHGELESGDVVSNEEE
jgi:UDP-N-acetylglucosamine diphosphorylase / glucose-1-phosphate thymidylyltransferase / UDP-N-acetylgalactosamine diphosphorylase / glucosamine-1-phosphate N-acetyltransferase / galactosamine-1-phosphate N-acetyltransferase